MFGKLDAVAFQFQTSRFESYGTCGDIFRSQWAHPVGQICMYWFLQHGNRVCSIITYSGIGWCHLYLSNSPRNHPSPRTSPSHCKPPITYQLRRCCKPTATADITDMGPYIYVFMKTSGYGNAFRIIGPCVENPTVKVESHTKEQWRWALMFLFVVLTSF